MKDPLARSLWHGVMISQSQSRRYFIFLALKMNGSLLFVTGIKGIKR